MLKYWRCWWLHSSLSTDNPNAPRNGLQYNLLAIMDMPNLSSIWSTIYMVLVIRGEAKNIYIYISFLCSNVIFFNNPYFRNLKMVCFETLFVLIHILQTSTGWISINNWHGMTVTLLCICCAKVKKLMMFNRKYDLLKKFWMAQEI